MEARKEWYVLHTYSGYENKVKENIEMRKESMNMQENIFRIVIPEEEVIEINDGVEKKKVDKTFPGYVLVEMIMSDQAWFIVRNTPGVTGFVGSHGAGSKPSPLLPEEIEAILGTSDLTARVELNVAIGDHVKIVDGAFSGLTGEIEEIDQEHEKLKVVIEMFGRETVAELEFSQVKKEEV
ncbi:transcription termination/antitermination protein NusG [Aerococcaceae bacterium NML210727]|nr:transcription termination/antitermination protein NusG [Aerococcaceae bacterium NML210727]MCW6654858.1 transcription termination/antitermination protein NusG [Aerococcaceae bacterium NML201296]MCW6661650.1 transcription termination/antitermination protein NusG [Aerococcaceae bacterium NML201209]MCW6662642.1 transcription termination/antitermination protein NusG [Aerococcaceae bacterium NML190073]MCW6665784.1 transcription termination/antitermination protein NusG [Aerococcaceae bacterium NML1